jgi:hypothetical protein
MPDGMKGFRSYVYLLVETIRRTAQIDSEKGEAIRTRRSRTTGADPTGVTLCANTSLIGRSA